MSSTTKTVRLGFSCRFGPWLNSSASKANEGTFMVSPNFKAPSQAMPYAWSKPMT